MAELKRWIGRLLFSNHWSIEFILHWSIWRRAHQADALRHHYRKHLKIPENFADADSPFSS